MLNWFKSKPYQIVFVVFVLGAGLGYSVNETFSLTASSENSRKSFEKKRRVFNTVVNYVRDMYVDTDNITPRGVYYGAIEGVIKSLDDPHSRLMKPDRYEEMKTEINQEFGGLGIYITIRNGRLTVIAPIQGTPAFKAGLEPGDMIAAINGDPTKDLDSANEAVEILRGPKGSDVELTIERRGRRFDVTITRGEIPIQSVYSTFLENEGRKIGYLKITNFGEQTHREVENNLEELRSQGMESLIVDVRNNPGGSLKSAHKVADLWIEDGLIVYTRGRAPGQDKDYSSNAQGTEPSNYPMAILANRGSASGSEILVGALKDHERAVVMGDTTFGKGLVQSVFPLQDGSALALTTARYFTPSGRMIQDKGIPPQVSIKQSLPDTSVQRQMARLSRGDTVLNFVRDHQPIDDADIQQLIGELRTQGFTLEDRYIESEIRREQLALEGKTPVASPTTDPQLRKALDHFSALISKKSPADKVADLKSPPNWL